MQNAAVYIVPGHTFTRQMLAGNDIASLCGRNPQVAGGIRIPLWFIERTLSMSGK
ncbi:hypothetical protein D3C86_2180420 [compost metagenome]